MSLRFVFQVTLSKLLLLVPLPQNTISLIDFFFPKALFIAYYFPEEKQSFIQYFVRFNANNLKMHF